MMEFTLNKTNDTHAAFEYELDGARVAEITWAERDGVMHMDHTYVSDVLTRARGSQKVIRCSGRLCA